MKVLGGVVAPDAGVIRYRRRSSARPCRCGRHGGRHRLRSPGTEPVREPRRRGERVHRPRAAARRLAEAGRPQALRQRVQPLLERLGCDFGPDTLVESLSLAQRQLVEIAKALSLEARLVIMDEPTSSLTIAETERLLRVIAGLKADGVSVIFISHRLRRGRALRRPRRRAARRPRRRRVGPRTHQPRRDDPADDRARAEGLYTPPARAPGDAGARGDRARARGAYPGAGRRA